MVELEAQADAQSVQDIEQEQDPVAVQERWGSYQNYTGIAAIYYLATPDGIPESNDTQYWAPESDKSKLFGKINTNGAVWEKVDNKDNKQTKACRVSGDSLGYWKGLQFKMCLLSFA